MRRLLLVLAFAASFLVGAWGFSDAAPGDLLRTNNQGGNQVRIPAVAGTPCWRLGSQTFRPDGVAFSACTATTSTSSTSTTSTTASTTSLAPTTTAPVTTSSSPPPTSSTSTTSTTTTSLPVSTTTTFPPSGGFVETFDGNSGLDRFIWGVYHRGLAHQHLGGQLPNNMNNNAYVGGTWSADHDRACGDAMSQRTLESEFQQDTTGANGWQPYVDFHLAELVYVCRDHVMDSMGDISAFTVLWFAPNQTFMTVNSVEFDVNLTDLGGRKWWKVGVVTDALYNATYVTSDNVRVPGHVVSDVGSSNLNGNLQGSDRLIATWGGAASAGYPGCLKVGNTQTGVCTGQSNDKMTRLPVSLVDNHNGTVTFTVDGTAVTRPGSFPTCPCRVIFYDQNYNPLKDGPVLGLTWHWDNIVVN